MVYIDRVRYKKDYYGNEYISDVSWTNSSNSWAIQTCTKNAMINFINQNLGHVKTKYLRNGIWYIGEEVHVVENSYLRTDANNIKADNLGNLPRF